MGEHVIESWTTAFSSSRMIAASGRVWPRSRRPGRNAGTSRVRRSRSTALRAGYAIVDANDLSGRQGRFGYDVSDRPPQLVLSERLFRSALSRERRRTDRFDEGFALLTIAAPQAYSGAVVAALAAATSDTDLIGWIEQGAVLAVILTDVATLDDSVVSNAENRLRQELACRLDIAVVDRMGIHSYMHAGPKVDGGSGLARTDPLRNDLQSIDARSPVYHAVKRTLDIVGSLVLLALTLPIFFVVALLVKLTSPGAVLFSQRRVGLMARPFTMLKFRTMQANNDPALHQKFVTEFIKSGSHRAVSSAGATVTDAKAPFKIQNDPRTTPIGRFLRRTSLDELPQLWNVLKGEMSLVGPRPPIAYELDNYRSWHWRRVLEAKPGVTGLWQVTGRSRTTFDEMVRLDLRYARTRSLWLDLKILVATPRAVITGKGAS